MYYDNDSGMSGFLTGMIVGAALGAGIALLAAPQSGRETRTRIIRRVRPDAERGDEYEDMAREDVLRELRRRRRKARRNR